MASETQARLQKSRRDSLEIAWEAYDRTVLGQGRYEREGRDIRGRDLAAQRAEIERLSWAIWIHTDR